MKVAFPRLYAIMDAAVLRMPELTFAQMMAEAGVELLQYRNKGQPAGLLLQTCKSLVENLAGTGVRFVVNDRADVAAMVGAGGVHVGQEDLQVEDARKVCSKGCWVGISTHTLAQVKLADQTSADYIAVGPIYATTSKEKPEPVVGLGLLGEARKVTAKPLVAIGGITLNRAEEVFGAGADCVAVIGDLLAAADPRERAGEFLRVAREGRSG
jgi:thiamine-phosphate pyrophosphorylase